MLMTWGVGRQCCTNQQGPAWVMDKLGVFDEIAPRLRWGITGVLIYNNAFHVTPVSGLLLLLCIECGSATAKDYFPVRRSHAEQRYEVTTHHSSPEKKETPQSLTIPKQLPKQNPSEANFLTAKAEVAGCTSISFDPRPPLRVLFHCRNLCTKH